MMLELRLGVCSSEQAVNGQDLKQVVVMLPLREASGAISTYAVIYAHCG